MRKRLRDVKRGDTGILLADEFKADQEESQFTGYCRITIPYIQLANGILNVSIVSDNGIYYAGYWEDRLDELMPGIEFD